MVEPMHDLYRYKRPAEEIVYHIQTKLQTQISDDLRYDIFSNVLKAVVDENELALSGRDYWKQEYYDLKNKKFPLKWNEVRIKLAQYIGKELTADTVLEWMMILDDDGSIR